MEKSIVKKFPIFFLAITSTYVHSATLDFSQDFASKSVGYLHTVYEEDTLGSNAMLLTPNTCLCTSHALQGHPTFAFIIFHPNPGTVLKNKEEFTETSAALDLSTAKHHPSRDLCIVTLEKSLPNIPILPLALERPITSSLRAYTASYGRLDMKGASTGGVLHTFSMNIQEMMVPWPKKAILYLVMEGEKHYSSGKVIKSHPGDSGAPLLLENSVIGLLHGTYEYKENGTSCTYTLITPLYTEGIPAWINKHIHIKPLDYIRSLLGF